MSPALPDITGVAALPDVVWRELGRRFREAGLNNGYIRTIWPSGFKAYDRLQRPMRLWRLRERQDGAAFFYRAFMLRDPIEEGTAAEVLGASLLEQLVDAGVLRSVEPSLVVSRFDCRLFMGHFVFSDDLSGGGDAVFGSGPGTMAFAGVSPRRLGASRALDLGCGAGAVALWMATHTDRVVAADVNPRALPFVRINAAVNGVVNIQTCLTDLFDGVGNERFDVVLSQLPFVPSPAKSAVARYRHGGPAGDEIVRRMIPEVPDHLTQDGCAVIVFERVVHDDEADGDVSSVAALVESAGHLRALIIEGADVHPDVYSMRYAALDLGRGIEHFDAAALAMRRHLSAQRVRSVRPAIGVIGRSSERRGWVTRVRAGESLWDECGEGSLDRLFECHNWLHQHPHAVSSLPAVRIPDGSAVVKVDDAGGICVGLPRGHIFRSLQFTDLEWDRVRAWERGERIEVSSELAAKVAQAGLLDV